MYLILLLLLPLLPCITTAEEESFEFPDEDLESRIEAVNEGELEFLHPPPAESVHHHINRIQISVDSLDHGWVELNQCHHHLDPVPYLEIVYHPQRIRHIKLNKTTGKTRQCKRHARDKPKWAQKTVRKQKMMQK